jgi:hypothetical protein
MSVFVHAQGIKTVHAMGGGSKNGKILSTYIVVECPQRQIKTCQDCGKFIEKT